MLGMENASLVQQVFQLRDLLNALEKRMDGAWRSADSFSTREMAILDEVVHLMQDLEQACFMAKRNCYGRGKGCKVD